MKDKLIKLAKKKGFVSGIIGKSVESIYSNKDFYYLWMCELQKWLRVEHNCFAEVNMHSHEDKSDEDNFSCKEDFLFSGEVNNYGKNFDIEQGYKSDFEITYVKDYGECMETTIYEALKLIKDKH